MDQDNIQGAAERVGSAVDSVTGDLYNSTRAKARELASQAQDAYGDTVDTVRSAASEQPLAAVAMAAGLGFIIGFLVARR